MEHLTIGSNAGSQGAPLTNSSWTNLAEEVAPYVLSLCRRAPWLASLGIGHEDVLQEAQLRFWMALPHMKPGSNPRTFCARIARNYIIDRYRHYWSAKGPGGAVADLDAEWDPADPARHFEEGVDARLDLEVHCEELSPVIRRSLELLAEGYDPEAIARILYPEEWAESEKESPEVRAKRRLRLRGRIDVHKARAKKALRGVAVAAGRRS